MMMLNTGMEVRMLASGKMYVITREACQNSKRGASARWQPLITDSMLQPGRSAKASAAGMATSRNCVVAPALA